jgi:hypothetical protein
MAGDPKTDQDDSITMDTIKNAKNQTEVTSLDSHIYASIETTFNFFYHVNKIRHLNISSN